MDHQAAQELFSDYLEGELSPQEQEELAAHLTECEACREELEDLKKTMRSLSGLKVLPPPEGFVSKVQQKIRKRSRGRFFAPERLLMRVPFEWISFIIIMLMLATYMILVLGQGAVVKPEEGAKQAPGVIEPGAKSGSLPREEAPPPHPRP